MVIIPKIPAGFLVECFRENRYKIAENTIGCHIFPPAFASLQVRSSFSLTRLCRTFPACHIQYSFKFKWFTSCYFNMSTEFFKIRKQMKAPTSRGSLKSHWYFSFFLCAGVWKDLESIPLGLGWRTFFSKRPIHALKLSIINRYFD